MRKRTLQPKRKVVCDEQTDVMIEGVQFWRECPADDKPVGFLPMKLVFTEGNINGMLLFFETHGLMYSEEAVAQIQKEIATSGEADIWLLTQR